MIDLIHQLDHARVEADEALEANDVLRAKVSELQHFLRMYLMDTQKCVGCSWGRSQTRVHDPDCQLYQPDGHFR